MSSELHVRSAKCDQTAFVVVDNNAVSARFVVDNNALTTMLSMSARFDNNALLL